jgi:hypothetical protein
VNRHCIQKSLWVDEGQKGHALPCHALAVHVNLERCGVEIDDWRIFFRHERVEHGWYMLPARCWENTHQLLKGLERFADIETYVHLVDLFEVGSKRSKMKGIIPLPRGGALIVVR